MRSYRQNESGAISDSHLTARNNGEAVAISNGVWVHIYWRVRKKLQSEIVGSVRHISGSVRTHQQSARFAKWSIHSALVTANYRPGSRRIKKQRSTRSRSIRSIIYDQTFVTSTQLIQRLRTHSTCCFSAEFFLFFFLSLC